MNEYKIFTAASVAQGNNAPQVTLYQIATMLAHQGHAECVKEVTTGKYKWYDESLLLIPQFVLEIVEHAKLALSAYDRRHMPEGSIAMLVVGQGEEAFSQWPIRDAIAVRHSNSVDGRAFDKCLAYKKALDNYWMDIETGIRPDQEAPDLRDFLYHRLPV